MNNIVTEIQGNANKKNAFFVLGISVFLLFGGVAYEIYRKNSFNKSKKRDEILASIFAWTFGIEEGHWRVKDRNRQEATLIHFGRDAETDMGTYKIIRESEGSLFQPHIYKLFEVDDEGNTLQTPFGEISVNENTKELVQTNSYKEERERV